MANTIITKNSATATAVPTAGELVQGELAVNVTDKRIFTENSGGTVVELGVNPSSVTTASATVTGGTINGTTIGASTAAAGTFTSLTATSANVTGTVTADGLTIDGASNPLIRLNNTDTTLATNQVIGSVEYYTNDATTNSTGIAASIGAFSEDSFGVDTYLSLKTRGDQNASANATERLRISSQGDVSFYEDTGTTAKFYWDASAESLGIGTSSPTFKLDLAVTDTTAYSTSAYAYEPVRITNNGAGGIAGLLFQTTSTGTANTAQATISVIAESASSKNTAITFGTRQNSNSAIPERLRLDSSGNLGLGVTPSGWRTATKGFQIGVQGFVSGNTANQGTRIGTNAYVNSSNAETYIATDAASYYQQFQGSHTWLSAPSGTAGAAINFGGAKMTLDASGNLLVGTTSQQNGGSTFSGLLTSYRATTTTSNAVFLVSSDVGGTATVNFKVLANGNVQNTNNSYGAISDAKLKENVADATPKLEKLNQVRVVNFNMIGDEQKQIGVIAQEIEQIFPSMVEESPDRDMEGNDLGTVTKSVKYSVFVPMLIKAIQEQQTIIESLTARVSALEGN